MICFLIREGKNITKSKLGPTLANLIPKLPFAFPALYFSTKVGCLMLFLIFWFLLYFFSNRTRFSLIFAQGGPPILFVFIPKPPHFGSPTKFFLCARPREKGPLVETAHFEKLGQKTRAFYIFFLFIKIGDPFLETK